MSRTFLIDAQCLFFSLLSLFVALIAVRRASFRLFIISAIIFAAAFNTKLYAVFTLIPLLAFFFYYQPRNLKHTLKWLVGFSIPVLIAIFLWYQVIAGIRFILYLSTPRFNFSKSKHRYAYTIFCNQFFSKLRDRLVLYRCINRIISCLFMAKTHIPPVFTVRCNLYSSNSLCCER